MVSELHFFLNKKCTNYQWTNDSWIWYPYGTIRFGQYYLFDSTQNYGVYVIIDGSRERHVDFLLKYKLQQLKINLIEGKYLPYSLVWHNFK